MTEKTLTEVEIKLAELRRKNAQSLAKLSAAGLAMAGAIVEASEEEFFTKQELRLIRSCQRYANDDPCGLPGHNLMMLVATLTHYYGGVLNIPIVLDEMIEKAPDAPPTEAPAA